MDLVFKLPVFEGPLDLLLYLVRKKKVDIREIPISQLADEFVEYLEHMKKLDMKITSDFLEMASTLMELKSKMLIPRVKEEEKESIDRKKEELYRRIEEYSKVKEIVSILKKEENLLKRKRVRVRNVFFEKIEGIEKFREILKRIWKEEAMREAVHRVKSETLSVEEMMERILDEIDGEIEILRLLSRAENVYELIVRLLAILELVKIGKLILVGDNRIRRYTNAAQGRY
ncbi:MULTISPECIES: ScpA family protein [unclassified Thermotoga]|uniref:segregation and condensation protein A n=1 Tax=unclassified Thermotoga TaxID=2631113 RepID=UPI000280E9F6|nr:MULTISPECIES: ScpA family protein [unclassified Thermotoga]AIY85993.1 chromosome segregation and condensation protein ScpA [Thermotoga sp. 2812B]EJX26722.1 chromosome segregation and condensation protein ScpA [Thermotoga sp. EMP]